MKKTTMWGRTNGTLTVLTALLLGLMMATTVAAKEEKLPEVSKDGLHLVPHTKVRAFYLKPGAELSSYDEVKILDCFVQFKANYQRDYNMNELGLSGMVTTKQMDEMKTWLSAEFTKVFTKELEQQGHQVVDTTGPGILILRPAIINLDVTAPDIMQPGIEQTFTASAGQMTLYMELYDSANSELIARIIDPEAGQEGGMAMVANRVTNSAEADRILRYWSDLLSKHLGEAKPATAAN